MKKLLAVLIAGLAITFSFSNYSFAQALSHEGIVDSLTTLDPSIVKYFPRWKVCEPDLAIQIYQSFAIKGYNQNDLSQQDIVILAAPRESLYDPYEIMMITCGKSSMNAVQIESNFGDILVGFLSGDLVYSGIERGTKNNTPKRGYCLQDIPTEIPLTSSETETIIDYLQPTNVTHAFTMSLFEQTLKIGESGFWIRSMIGNDEVGYPFWSAGLAKIVLQRPLYINKDNATSKSIPYLINAYLGAGYRITSGLSTSNSLFSWVPDRTLNTGPGGKFVAGFDFHMPFHPSAGLALNVELPLQEFRTKTIDKSAWGYLPVADGELSFAADSPFNPEDSRITKKASVLGATGQISAFYHWWLDPEHPENYFKFNLGISYSEVQEYAFFRVKNEADYLTKEFVDSLKMYKPNEFMDWLFFKAEYRNQATFPFGASIQISNQIMLGRVYLPLLGNWLYIEGRYSTPLRDARPYEKKNFFMISPVIRLTI
jgi:hypothetical protein